MSLKKDEISRLRNQNRVPPLEMTLLEDIAPLNHIRGVISTGVLKAFGMEWRDLIHITREQIELQGMYFKDLILNSR